MLLALHREFWWERYGLRQRWPQARRALELSSWQQLAGGSNFWFSAKVVSRLGATSATG